MACRDTTLFSFVFSLSFSLSVLVFPGFGGIVLGFRVILQFCISVCVRIKRRADVSAWAQLSSSLSSLYFRLRVEN